MASSIEALINPDLLIWARKSAGFTEIGDVARKIFIKLERLQAWERGDTRPTIAQLRKLGAVYKRPIAVFYLPKPPKDFQPLRDFRRLPGDLLGNMSPELIFAVRNAYARIEIALDLYRDVELTPPTFTETASLEEEPEELGVRTRELLGVSLEQQMKWSEQYTALANWRAALEKLGIFVFQISGVETAEMRGFSISKGPLPVIAANRKDPPRARIFTMLHELIHIMLRSGGLCDLENETGRPPEEQRTEIFCNHVAGAILVPKKLLLNLDMAATHKNKRDWSDEEIEALAKTFGGVSRETLVRRLLIVGLVTQTFYEQKRKQYQEEYKRQAKRTVIVLPHINVISTVGKPFANLVFRALYQEKITTSDVADYFEVRLKHLDKIEQMTRTSLDAI